MATYLVTGAAGFIASRVCDFLLEAGHTVIGLDNMNDAYDVRLKEWRLRRFEGKKNMDFRRADICDRKTVQEVFDTAKARGQWPIAGVINLAARAGVRQSVENPWVYFDTNVTGTLNLLEMCRVHEIQTFVLASTSSLYGSHNPRPFREDADTNRVLSPYAASKKSAEALCYTYHYLYGINVATPRYFTVYGPAGRPDMSLFRFVQWVMEEKPVLVFGDGSQSRDFTFVDDIARGTIACMNTHGYHTVNLGSDKPVVLMDAIRLIENLTGKKGRLEHKPMHPADVPATWADISVARSLLSWEPKTPFEQGVNALVKWYDDNRSWASQITT